MDTLKEFDTGRSARVLRRAPLLLFVVAAILLAACGSSTSSYGSSTSNTPTSTSNPTAANSKTIVMVSHNSRFGALLVDANGMTLYTLTNGGQPVACTGECATLWPPVLLPSGVTTAPGAAGVTGLGVASMNGGMQVTEGGDPLYRYSGDSAAGDTNGDGLSSFGGVWHVAGTTRPASGGAATTTTPTTPTTTGGYGGYGGYGG